MAVYSINDIEKLCGIKAHTIRIWEKRYGILTPRRTNTNIRYYLDEDLQKLLNISLLNRNGVKISKIAKMGNQEMKQLAANFSDIHIEAEDKLDGLMFAMLELDDFKFSKIIDHHIDSEGFEATMNDIVYPLLEKLSIMWVSGSIKGIHENFVVNIIKRKTIVAIDKLTTASNPDALKYMIYLPKGETQELSLLYLHFLLKQNRLNVINLGMDVPLLDLVDCQKIYNPDKVITIFNDSFADESLQPYIDELYRHLDGCEIMISGYQTVVQNLVLPPRIRIVSSVLEIKNQLEIVKK